MILNQIEERYNFEIPAEYKSMFERGYFTLEKPAHCSELIDSKYVWLYEMEWISIDEILKFEFEEYARDGFVPFARNGAGEKWCW